MLSQKIEENKETDEKVEKFLQSYRYKWKDTNVPESDGKVLYDLILKNHYTKALEIGTSTGHSAIWMSWELVKQVVNWSQSK